MGGAEETRTPAPSISTEDIRSVEPNLYNRLRTAGLKSFTIDMWVDDLGRVVRLEQWLKVSGLDGHNVMVISDFSEPFRQKAPSN